MAILPCGRNGVQRLIPSGLFPSLPSPVRFLVFFIFRFLDGFLTWAKPNFSFFHHCSRLLFPDCVVPFLVLCGLPPRYVSFPAVLKFNRRGTIVL